MEPVKFHPDRATPWGGFTRITAWFRTRT